MVALLLAGVLLTSIAPDFVNIRILATSDLQSRVRPSSDFDAPGIPRRLLGGWDNLETQVAKWRVPYTLLLDCGGFAFGSPEADSTHGRVAVDYMNALDYDAAAVGARDFSGGAVNLEFLARRARFPVLAAPMLDVVLRRQVPLFRPYVIKEVDDIRMALIGITDPDIPGLNTLENTLGLPVDAPEVQVSRYLGAVRAEDPGLIIAFGHISQATGAMLIDSFPDLDLVVCRGSKDGPTRDGLVPVGSYGQRLAVADVLYHLGDHRVEVAQVKVLNVLPAAIPDSLVGPGGELAAQAVLVDFDTVVTATPREFPADEQGLVSLGSTVAEAVRREAGVQVVVLPTDAVEPGLPEGLLTARDLHRVVPFGERLRSCTLSDTLLEKLLSGLPADGLAPFLAGAGYFVLGDTARWPIVSQVARIRTAGLTSPFRVVTTANLLEKAGIPDEGRLLPGSLTDMWLEWASARDDLGPVPPARLYLASPGLVELPVETSGPININTATAELLEQLPGVGPRTAERIVEYRTAHGRFGSVDELQHVKGIGPKKLEQIRPLATVR